MRELSTLLLRLSEPKINEAVSFLQKSDAGFCILINGQHIDVIAQAKNEKEAAEMLIKLSSANLFGLVYDTIITKYPAVDKAIMDMVYDENHKDEPKAQPLQPLPQVDDNNEEEEEPIVSPFIQGPQA